LNNLKATKTSKKTAVNILDLRLRSIEMLKEVTQILNENKIFFWLDFGSLLGAVRDGRSIVWDGDYDLSMFNDEFDESHCVWNKIKLRNYSVKINKNNIKIISNNWSVGYYKIDIHRIKKINNSKYAYYYGDVHSKNNRFFESILDAINVYKTHPLLFPEFDQLTLFLLKNGVEPNNLEKTNSFEFIKGTVNSPQDFILKNKSSYLKSEYYNSIGKKLKVIHWIIKILPKFIINILEKSIDNFLRTKKRNPLMVFEIPKKYLDKFENIMFHGIKFNIPYNAEDYLASLFGPDWRIPKLGHWRQEVGKASGVMNFKS